MLFSGDSVATGEGRPVFGPFHVERTTAIASFHRLAALEPTLVCVPHGDPLTESGRSGPESGCPGDGLALNTASGAGSRGGRGHPGSALRVSVRAYVPVGRGALPGL